MKATLLLNSSTPASLSLFFLGGKKDLPVAVSTVTSQFSECTVSVFKSYRLMSLFLFSPKLTEKGSVAENLLYAELSWSLKQSLSLLFSSPFPFLYRKQRSKKTISSVDQNVKMLYRICLRKCIFKNIENDFIFSDQNFNHTQIVILYTISTLIYYDHKLFFSLPNSNSLDGGNKKIFSFKKIK